MKISIFVSEDALFFDIAHYINSNLEEKIGRFRCIIVSSNECLIVSKASDNIIDSSLRGYIFCCEVDPKLLKNDYTNFIIHLRDDVNKELKSYPRMVTVTPTMTLKDLRINIYGFMRRFIDLPSKLNEALGNKFEKLIENFTTNGTVSYDEYNSIVREEYEFIFNATTIDEEIKKEIEDFIERLPFELYLGNAKEKDSSLIVLFNNNLNKQLADMDLKERNEENTPKRSYKFFDENESLKDIIELTKQGYKIVLNFLSENFINAEKMKYLQTCVNVASKEKTKAYKGL